jgi:hypothetical protein
LSYDWSAQAGLIASRLHGGYTHIALIVITANHLWRYGFLFFLNLPDRCKHLQVTSRACKMFILYILTASHTVMQVLALVP